MSETKPNKMKIVVLGDSGVGKTTLINSYLKIKDNNNGNNLLPQSK
jgi:GTPase SAR1 family protein